MCIPYLFLYKYLKYLIGGLESCVLAPSVEGQGFESPVRSSQRLKKWHLLVPCLVFTIIGLEQGWLEQC